MTEETTNLLLEHLRGIRGQVDRLREEVGDAKMRVSSIEHHVASLHVDVTGLNHRMDRFDERLARIEKRLDLVDAPDPRSTESIKLQVLATADWLMQARENTKESRCRKQRY